MARILNLLVFIDCDTSAAAKRGVAIDDDNCSVLRNGIRATRLVHQVSKRDHKAVDAIADRMRCNGVDLVRSVCPLDAQFPKAKDFAQSQSCHKRICPS
jgi:hypothetical protein